MAPLDAAGAVVGGLSLGACGAVHGTQVRLDCRLVALDVGDDRRRLALDPWDCTLSSRACIKSVVTTLHSESRLATASGTARIAFDWLSAPT